jgi:hypothetical protein
MNDKNDPVQITRSGTRTNNKTKIEKAIGDETVRSLALDNDIKEENKKTRKELLK